MTSTRHLEIFEEECMVVKISRIIFYDEPAVPEIDIDGLVRFARDSTGVIVERRGPAEGYGGPDTHAGMAAARVRRHDVPFEAHAPLASEIRDEEERGRRATDGTNITCYDGIQLLDLFSQIIPTDEMTRDVFHVIFTSRLCCTYSYTDYRYHGRLTICSNPSIISTTGMVEAPARPRQYHIDSIISSRTGGDPADIDKKYVGQFLRYHDSRIAGVSRACFLQALLYYISGRPFCNDPNCSIYNAHWQAEMLHAQARGLCKSHEAVLKTAFGPVNDLN